MGDGREVSLTPTIEIKGKAYIVTLFAPTRAIKLMAKLTKIVGEPLAVMAKVDEKKGITAQSLFPEAAKALVSKLDADETVAIIKEIMTSVADAGTKKMIIFDDEFAGNLGSMVLLLSKVIELQFGDFFAALGETYQS